MQRKSHHNFDATVSVGLFFGVFFFLLLLLLFKTFQKESDEGLLEVSVSLKKKMFFLILRFVLRKETQ